MNCGLQLYFFLELFFYAVSFMARIRLLLASDIGKKKKKPDSRDKWFPTMEYKEKNIFSSLILSEEKTGNYHSQEAFI